MNTKRYMLAAGLLLMLIPCLLNAAKYAGEVFYMSPGVANQALGNTGLTNEGSASAAWWNPALLALQSSHKVELMHAEQFEGLMQFNHISTVIGNQNRFGLVITHIGIDDIKLTALENDSLPPSANNQPVIKGKPVNNNDLMLYFGISRTLRNNLHMGVTPKLAYRNLAKKQGFGFGADLGFLWDINQVLRLGVVGKDFLSTHIIWENGTKESVIPSVHTELGYRTAVTSHEIPLHLTVGVESLLEGRKEAATISTGSYSADFHAGLAVLPIPQLQVMTGYDTDAFTAGMGVYIRKLSIEYAVKLASQDDLGYSQRISAGWKW